MNARVRGGNDASNDANGGGSEADAIDLGGGSPFIVLDVVDVSEDRGRHGIRPLLELPR